MTSEKEDPGEIPVATDVMCPGQGDLLEVLAGIEDNNDEDERE